MPAGVIFSIPATNGSAGHATTQTSLFVKVPASPSGDTTLWDYDLEGGDYCRLKLSATRHLVLEFQFTGYGSAIGDLGVLGTDTWTWVSCGFSTSGGLHVRGDVTPYGGATTTTSALASSGSVTGTTQTGVPFGVGVSLSSAYAGFPNLPDAGWLCSKLIQTQISANTAAGNPDPMPSTDFTPSVDYREYLAHDPLGVVLTLTDSGTAGVDLDAGLQGLTIVTDGPPLQPASPGPGGAHEGDISIYHLGEWISLHAGTEGQELTVVSGDPAWTDQPTGYSLPDATTSSVGGVEVAAVPLGAHPVALVTEQLGAASGVATLDANSHVQQQAVRDVTEAATDDTLTSSSTIVNNLNRLRYQLAQLGTGAWTSLRAMVQLSPSGQQTGAINVSGEAEAQDFKADGLTGATSASRYVGGTAGGHPTTGTFAVGDFVVAETGGIWVCTTAGTPGTWTQVGAGGGGGGLSSPLTTTGDLWGYDTADDRFAVGSNGTVLTADSTQAAGLRWATPATGSVTSVALAAPGIFSISGSPVTSSGTLTFALVTESANVVFAGPTTGVAATPTFRALVAADLPLATSSAVGASRPDTTTITVSAGVLSTVNNGTVTSVALSLPAIFSVSGSPVTSNGTLTATLATQSANQIFSGPSSGSAAVPTFRAMVSADLPSAPTVSGEVTASDFKASGLTGATAATRYVGGTTTGHPTSGTFAVGDYVITQDASVWVCTTAGTPGTWTQIAGGGGSLSVTTKGDLQGYSTAAARQPVGADGTFLAADSSQATGLSYKFPAGIAGVSTLSTQLSADVTMTSANTYYDGPSLSLSAGIWLVTGTVTCLINSGESAMTAKLWDGTTVFDSAGGVTGPSANDPMALSVSAVVSPTTTTTYKIGVACSGSGGKIKAAANFNAAGNTASTLTAVQLTGAPASGPGALMPAVRCYNSANISVNSATLTALTFDTNRVDQGTSTSQHSTSSSTNQIVCRQAGFYNISGVFEFSPSSAGNLRLAVLRINGSTEVARKSGTINGTGACYLEVSTSYYLSVGDYVELCAYQDSGGNLNVNNSGNRSPEFMMARIDSGPGAVQPNTKVQLDYEPSTDILNGTSIPATTWTDMTSNQSFTVDDTNSVVEVDVSGMAMMGNTTTGFQTGVRVVIDSGGTPTNKMVCGSAFINNIGTSNYTNVLAGSGTVSITGLSAGSHTVKLQIYQSNTGAMLLYCRPSTFPNVESLSVRVLERKQSSFPPSSTPAPAVRVKSSTGLVISNSTYTNLTFDTTEFDQGTSIPQHSTSSNTSRLTCQQAGVYQVTATVGWPSNATGIRQLFLNVNGTAFADNEIASSGAAAQTAQTVTGMYKLSVGDYVEAMVFQSSGGNLTIAVNQEAGSVFMMARIDTGGTGAVYVPTVKTTNYTILATDSMVVAGANSLTLTLPAASAYTGKAPLTIKNDNFTSTTVARAGSDTIDGGTTYSLASAYASAQFVTDGNTTWRVI